jgi:hypothetical protein
MDNDNDDSLRDRLGDMPCDLIDWLRAQADIHDLTPAEVIACLGIVLEGMLKGMYHDPAELRREAAKFTSIFTHVMALDDVRPEQLQ